MKAMNKTILAAFFVAFGFAVNAQDAKTVKQEPVKKNEKKPEKIEVKKIVSKRITKPAPVKKDETPVKKN